MQNPGSLRKRRSRNLCKVSGLGLLSTIGGHEQENSAHLNRQQDNSTRKASFVSVESSTIQISPAPSALNQKVLRDRPFLLSKGVIWRLKKILTLGRLVFHFPWSWGEIRGSNGVTNFEIQRWSKRWEIIWMLCSLIPLCCSSSLALYQFSLLIKNFKQAPTTYRLPFKNYEAVCWHLHSTMLNLLLLCYKEPMRNYANTLFAFNRHLIAEYGSNMIMWKQRGKLFMNVTVPIFFGQIVLSGLRYCMTHDSPGYLTHYWAEENGGHTPVWLIVLGAIQDFLTGGQLVSATLFLGWLSVAHATSLEFWIEEAHCNNESEITNDKLRDGDKSMELYRMAQVLSNLFNNSVGKVAVPMCAFMNWSAGIACGYLAVRSMNHVFIDEFPSSIFFPLGITLLLCSAFAQFQMSAMMHDMSASFLDSWSYTRDDGMRRFLVSCPFLRTTAAGFTSVTRNSLVGYFQTVSDHIIDCIITFP